MAGIGKFLIVAGIILVISMPQPSRAQETVRVLVFDDLPSVTLNIPEDYEVKDDAGMSGLSGSSRGAKIKLDRTNFPDGGVKIRAGDAAVNMNEYALTGLIEVVKTAKGRFRIINELDLESYVASVVGEEMGSKWPSEALKAQAVIARTYVLYRKARGGCDGYDLCATVNSQMFTGYAKAKPGPAQATADTAGEVLTYGGDVIETVYHSTCGGSTEDASEIWNRKYPFLQARDCWNCSDSPYGKWERAFSSSEIERAVRSGGFSVEGLSGIKVLERTKSGRVKTMKLNTSSGGVTIKGLDFRRLVGYSKLPSTMFDIQRRDGKFVFNGRGSGHGVGLCQWGAKKMAEQGKTYREILEYYYPGTEVSKVSDKVQ
jgi:stage II sporulation protein D